MQAPVHVAGTPTHFLPPTQALTGGNMALVGKVKLPLTAGGLGAAEINMHQAPSSIRWRARRF
jgi:hypothetical protein